MGNCLRISEDRENLLQLPPTQHRVEPVILPSAYQSSATSDMSIPKSLTVNRSSVNTTKTTDIKVIKEAQSRNLFEHLQLLSFNEKLTKQTDCAICLIDFVSNEQVRQLPCDGAHVFHPSCIDGWLQKSLTCPQCSTNVDAALLLKFVPRANNNDDDD